MSRERETLHHPIDAPADELTALLTLVAATVRGSDGSADGEVGADRGLTELLRCLVAPGTEEELTDRRGLEALLSVTGPAAAPVGPDRTDSESSADRVASSDDLLAIRESRRRRVATKALVIGVTSAALLGGAAAAATGHLPVPGIVGDNPTRPTLDDVTRDSTTGPDAADRLRSRRWRTPVSLHRPDIGVGTWEDSVPVPISGLPAHLIKHRGDIHVLEAIADKHNAVRSKIFQERFEHLSFFLKHCEIVKLCEDDSTLSHDTRSMLGSTVRFVEWRPPFLGGRLAKRKDWGNSR